MSTGKIGAKIVLEGEAQYRKALRDIKTEQAELRSEMKLSNTQFKDSQNSMDALTKKYQILSKQVETSAKKVEVYEKAMQTSSKQEEEAVKRIDELKNKLDSAQKEYAEMTRSSESTAEAMEKQQKAIDKLSKELENANSDYDKAKTKTQQYQTQLNLANAEMQGFQNELKDTEKYLNEAKNSTDKVAHSIDEYGKETEDATEKTNVFGDVLKANLTSQVIIDGAKALVRGIKDIATACIDSGMEFEAAMSNVQALSGATNSELERMADKAKSLGASTIYSASEVADAMSYMSLAGWNTQQTLQGIDSVLNLAAASSMDLAQASDIVTDYITAFGLKAEDANKFTDQLAYAMANSNTTVEMLGESFKNVAATASSMGFSVEDTTSALMTMANAGVKGGEAGTSLRAIMIRLATDTKDCREELEKYGVSITDENDNLLSLSEIIYNTASAFEGLSDTEQANLAKAIAGQNQYTGLMTILQGVSDAAAESGMSLEDYADALANADGYAKKMADTMQDNLKGKLTALSSAMEGLKIATYEVFDEELKSGVETATGAVSRLTASVESGSLNTSLSRLSKNIGDLIDKVSRWAERNLPDIIDGLADIIGNADKIGAALSGIVAGLVAFKTASAGIAIVQGAMAAYRTVTEGATTAQLAMNAAANANPYVLLASAIIGVTVATAGLISTIETEDEVWREAAIDLVEGYDSITESVKEANAEISKSFAHDYYAALVNEMMQLNQQESLDEAQKKRLASIVKTLNEVYPNLNLAIDESTGKLNDNTNAIRQNVTQAQKQERIAKAQEQIAKAYETKEKALTNLQEAEQKLYEVEAEHSTEIARLNELQSKNTELTNAEVTEMQNLITAMGESYYIWQMLPESIDEASASVDACDRNIQNINDHMYDMYGVTIDANGVVTDLADKMDEMSESAANTAQSYITLSEEASKAITDLHTSVENSITGQMDLFSEWKEGEQIATKDLVKNLTDQTEALKEWSDNMAILADRGIDDGLYAKLAQMGPQGANYVAAFVSMSTDELKDYSKKFEAAMKLEDSVAESITQDYAEAAGFILEGMALGLEDDGVVTAAIEGVADDALEAFKKANDINSPSKLYEEWANYIPEGMAVGILDGEDNVIDTIDLVSTDMINEAENILNAGDFEVIGENIAQGLANGIESGRSNVLSTMQRLCEDTIKAAQTSLDIHSPSKKFEWLGEMSGDGYINGLQESMANVGNTINSAMNGMENVGSVASSSTNPISQLLSLVGEYLPEIAEKDTNVNVYADADPDGIFRIVQRKARQFNKESGEFAFS